MILAVLMILMILSVIVLCHTEDSDTAFLCASILVLSVVALSNIL